MTQKTRVLIILEGGSVQEVACNQEFEFHIFDKDDYSDDPKNYTKIPAEFKELAQNNFPPSMIDKIVQKPGTTLVECLTAEELDLLVGKLEGIALVEGCIFSKDPNDEQVRYSPSTDETQADPILHREKLVIEKFKDQDDNWLAIDFKGGHSYFGKTRLIAGLRCYVASQLGDVIMLPKPLIAY